MHSNAQQLRKLIKKRIYKPWNILLKTISDLLMVKNWAQAVEKLVYIHITASVYILILQQISLDFFFLGLL